jgi:hypothetical protein
MNKMKFIDLFTVEYKSKYFGNIIFDSYEVVDWVDVKYNDNDLFIMLSNCIIFDENKLKIFLGIIDKYSEIIQIVKDVIKNYSQNKIEIVGLDDIQNIESIVNRIYPSLDSLDFDEDNNKIDISISYFASEEYPLKVFSVEMDQELNIKRMNYEIDYGRKQKKRHITGL